MQNKYSAFLILFLFAFGSLWAGLEPEAYHESNVSQFNHAIKELHKLNLSGSEKILDIGSGDGLVSCHIAQRFIPNGQLIGIDNNADMVSFASSRQAITNVSYLCIDAVDYVVPNEYDAIVSFWTLHWISEYAKVLHNIALSLKPGSKALICHGIGVPPFPPIINKLLDTQEWNKYKNNGKILTYPSLLEVVSAVEKAGLAIEHLEVKKSGIWMPQDMVIKNWLSLSMFDFIPLELREKFCQEVLNEFICEYPLNEKNELFRWEQIVVMVLKK